MRSSILVVLTTLSLNAFAQLPEIDWDELSKTQPWAVTELYKDVPKVTPGEGASAPSDAVVLFDGKSKRNNN